MTSLSWDLMNLARRWAAGRSFVHTVKRVGDEYRVYVRLSDKQKARHVATVSVDWDGARESVEWVAGKPEGF